AVNPTTRVLYGSTANASPNFPGRLVIVDPNSAAVTVVGLFNPPSPPTTSCFNGSGGPVSLQDLSFRADGTLFGFCNRTLFVVNLTTGLASPVGTDAYGGAGLLAGG